MKNIVCMSYMEKRIADYNKQIQKCISDGVMTPQALKDKFFGISRQKMMLTKQANDGTLSPEKYGEDLQKQMIKDKKLYVYLTKINETQKADLVKERLNITQAELSEE